MAFRKRLVGTTPETHGRRIATWATCEDGEHVWVDFTPIEGWAEYETELPDCVGSGYEQVPMTLLAGAVVEIDLARCLGVASAYDDEEHWIIKAEQAAEKALAEMMPTAVRIGKAAN